MKKKIILFIFMIVTIIYNNENVYAALGTCTEIQTYYFMEAEGASWYASAADTPTNGLNETTFIPTIVNGNYEIQKISTNISGEEYKNYIEALEARKEYYKDSGKSNEEIQKTAYCHNGVCLNSGVDDSGFMSVTEDEIMAEGGYDSFVEKYMITGYDLDKNDGEAGEKGVEIVKNEDGTTKYNADGTINVKIDRDWSLTEKQQKIGGYDSDNDPNTTGAFLFPVVIEVKVTYSCEVPDPPKPASCKNISSNSFGAGCGGGSGNSEYSKEYSYTYDTGTVTEENRLALCPISGSSGRDIATAFPVFTQKGSLNFSYSKEKYAGGGISIRASYSNQASWNYCVDSEHTEPIMCDHQEYVPYCTGSGYKLDVDAKRCEKTDREEMTPEACKKIGGSYNSNTGKCKTVETKDYTCGWKSVDAGTDSGCLDVSKAEAEFSKRAAEEYQSGEAGQIKAPDSNVVGGGSVLLNDDGDDSPGSLSGPSGGVGGSWHPGTMVSTTMSFSLNNACINIFSAKVTYRTDGCKADEINGYNLYYIPLKMKDKSSFTINVSGFQLSSLAEYRDWNWNASCGVNVKQRLYGENKFVYRPVDLSPADAESKAIAVFPKSNGNPSENWEYFWSNDSVVEKEMTRDKLEYHGILSQNTVNSIKKYNGYGYSVFNEDVISKNGKSQILDDLGISWQNNINSVEYNALGKCEENCW